MSETRDSNVISDIATQVGSTKDIVKRLARAFYKVPNTISDTDPHFVSAVSLDFNTARSIAKANHLDMTASQMMQNADNISVTLSKMPGLKETAALHAQYLQTCTPMIEKARSALLEKENFEQETRLFVQQDLHEKLPQILKEIGTGKSKREIEDALAAMLTQEKNITPKIEKLENTVKGLRLLLEAQYKEMFSLMPFSARASMRPPAGVAPERNPNGPAAPAA